MENIDNEVIATIEELKNPNAVNKNVPNCTDEEESHLDYKKK